jgi:hypothetical protein
MRFNLLITFFLLGSLAAFSQNFTGQWKGEFYDKSSKFGSWGGNRCEYVLDLEIKGKTVTGYSYTYFMDGPKRYYTICKVEGIVDKKKKYVEVKEFERTKTNVPLEVNNCFQIHKLTYFKKSDGEETLEGNWIPAPKQQGNCGYGLSILTRRTLKSSYANYKAPPASTPKSSSPVPVPVKKLPGMADKNKTAIAKVKPVPTKPNMPGAPSPVKDSQLKQSTRTEPLAVKPVIPTIPSALGTRYEKRSNTVLKTIEVESESIKIDLYDNGEIDGDSVSLFLNGKLIVARKKLTTRPLTIRIPLEELEDDNELVMYADNLGSIPPNTALMIVTDGNKRYEVRITSDLQKSGTIKFVKKK